MATHLSFCLILTTDLRCKQYNSYILYEWKLRVRENRCLIEGHIATKGQCDSIVSSVALQLKPSSMVCWSFSDSKRLLR